MSDTALLAATGPCSLGTVLVARDAEGVRALLLGDDADTLLRDLRARFPGEAVAPDPDDRALAAATRVVDRPGSELGLPLALRGSPFRRRVWEALRTIPLGATASYGQLARELGTPGAARAVAGACAANAHAVVVPCHRVLGAGGRLAGYRWGTQRKRALLAREREAAR